MLPLVLSEAVPASYQKPKVKIFLMFSVSRKASMLLIQTPNTNTAVARPHASVTMCLDFVPYDQAKHYYKYGDRHNHRNHFYLTSLSFLLNLYFFSSDSFLSAKISPKIHLTKGPAIIS